MNAPPPEVAAAVTATVREQGGRVVALLARHFDDLELADESLQDALEEAVRVWPDRGVPDNPAAWLLTVARRKGIDRIRRAQSRPPPDPALSRDAQVALTLRLVAAG